MRKRLTERAMLAEVHLRNIIAKYRDLNGKQYRVAAIPEVGIFWMGKSGKPFYKKSVSLKNAETYGKFKIFDAPHYLEWDSAVRKNSQWRGMEYEDVPRGRVTHYTSPGNNKFIVYLPKELRRHESKIARAFKLPLGHVEFDYSDEHYRMR